MKEYIPSAWKNIGLLYFKCEHCGKYSQAKKYQKRSELLLCSSCFNTYCEEEAEAYISSGYKVGQSISN